MSDPIAEALAALTLLTQMSYGQATAEELQDLIGLANEVASCAHTELFRREDTR